MSTKGVLTERQISRWPATKIRKSRKALPGIFLNILEPVIVAFTAAESRHQPHLSLVSTVSGTTTDGIGDSLTSSASHWCFATHLVSNFAYCWFGWSVHSTQCRRFSNAVVFYRGSAFPSHHHQLHWRRGGQFVLGCVSLYVSLVAAQYVFCMV
jgi:hypothetical protein